MTEVQVATTDSVEVGGDQTVFGVTARSREYRATAEWSEGVLILRSLTVYASNVTGQVLGEVPVAAIRDAIASFVRENPTLVDNSGRSWPMFDVELPVELPRSGKRSRIDDQFLTSVAIAYLKTLEYAPRRSVQQLADELGQPRQKVASWISRARRENWLTSAVPGRAGAKPGPRLIEWMEERQ